MSCRHDYDLASGNLLSNCCWGAFNEDHEICLVCNDHAEGVPENEPESDEAKR